ncbi:MAG: DUF3365 domain-containing protein [Thiobacillus sp.]|nr:DUF3365 domain-containing protein [Thiobacillus sp.]
MKAPLILSLLLTACATNEAKIEAAQPEQIEASRAVATTLVTQLGGKLKAEISANGPASAVGVCKVIAPQIAADLSRQTGWEVGRVGTRARNAETGTPDAWESKALASFAERMKQGEQPDTMELAEVVTDASGKHLRYAKAIAVQPVCLTCHGAAESIPEGVKARLQVEYPMDKATGYRVGELRGAVVVKRPL